MARRILVVVDSRDSLAAVDRALELADREGGPVTALGLERPSPAGLVTPTAPDRATARHRAGIAAATREARRRAAEAGHDLEVVVRRGSPVEVIVGEAYDREVDLIVVEEAMPWLPRRARARGAAQLERATRRTVIVAPVPEATSPREAVRSAA